LKCYRVSFSTRKFSLNFASRILQVWYVNVTWLLYMSEKKEKNIRNVRMQDLGTSGGSTKQLAKRVSNVAKRDKG